MCILNVWRILKDSYITFSNPHNSHFHCFFSTLLLQNAELFLFLLLWFLSSENVSKWPHIIHFTSLTVYTKPDVHSFFKCKWTVFITAYSMILYINWVWVSSGLSSEQMWKPIFLLSLRSTNYIIVWIYLKRA